LKGKDKISDNYRKKVDEFLDNQAGFELFNPLNQEELDELWEEISTAMDIDEVWNNISSDLDIIMPVDSGSGIIVKFIAVVLVILIGIIPVKRPILDSGVGQPDILNETKQNEQSAELIITNKLGDSNPEEQVKGDISPAFRSSLDKSEDRNKSTPAEMNGIGLTQGTFIPEGIEIISKVLAAPGMSDSNLVISLDKTSIEKSSIPPALYLGYPENIKLPDKIDLNSLKINDSLSTAGFSLPLIDRGRLSGGIITLYKNTWLINHETLDGLRSESLNSTEIVFFPDVGLSLSYSLNKTWLLQADGFLYSNTGQEYHEYIYGHYSRKKITLRYSTIALSVKYKFIGKSLLTSHTSINLLAGGYFSILNYANQRINTDLQNIGSQYKKFDLGVRLGSEIELRLSDHLSLAPGLFLSFGIPNIYKDVSNIPGYLRRTHNGSAGFQFTFYYHFD
jgi:hypothetical protein